MKKPKHINWVNTLFLTLTPLTGIIGTALLVAYAQPHAATWALMSILLLASGLSITAGYHRLFAHRTYQASWPLRFILLFFATGTFEGNALEWCTDHRRHHLYTDTDKDPYNIKKGFWYAHIGWLFTLNEAERDFSNVEDLKKDPLIRFQSKYFKSLAVLIGFGLPTLIASFWHDALAGFIIAGALRISLTHHMTFCINSVCHIFGKKQYSARQSAVDNWFTAFFTLGEGYHNFHHQFPLDYRNGIRFYDFDPTKWLIKLFSWCRLAYNLKSISNTKIFGYRVNYDHKHFIEVTRAKADSIKTNVSHHIKSMYDSLLESIAHIEELEKEYRKLKNLDGYRKQLKIYRKRIRRSTHELRKSISAWEQLIRLQLRSSMNAALK